MACSWSSGRRSIAAGTDRGSQRAAQVGPRWPQRIQVPPHSQGQRYNFRIGRAAAVDSTMLENLAGSDQPVQV
jgi:hypothetical protein